MKMTLKSIQIWILRNSVSWSTKSGGCLEAGKHVSLWCNCRKDCGRGLLACLWETQGEEGKVIQMQSWKHNFFKNQEEFRWRNLRLRRGPRWHKTVEVKERWAGRGQGLVEDADLKKQLLQEGVFGHILSWVMLGKVSIFLLSCNDYVKNDWRLKESCVD